MIDDGTFEIAIYTRMRGLDMRLREFDDLRLPGLTGRRPRTVRTPQVKEQILDMVEENPEEAPETMENGSIPQLVAQILEDPHFTSRVLWTDKAHFSRDGVFNQNNLHCYGFEDPYFRRENHVQDRFAVNV
ncbi:hypothetical protein TcasGA2_TC006073 [Tribolium castaneum]|uniref:Uncharacterized protein n=1 Tax=Tribolium castaneum TaxID=7070 RepID=D6WYD2_TRICA|nr:hypothetical protein TcasGA2_TC006073 [Tribolium castaneum]